MHKWRPQQVTLVDSSGEDEMDGQRESASLTVIILTFNESIHIERCIRSAQRVADDVLVVDSYSTDDTVEIARRLGARVMQNAWINYATQLNWALQNGEIKTDWVMRLDADEFLSDQLVECLRRTLASAPNDVGGFEVKRIIRFLGREIRHGGMAPLWVLRFWRNGWAVCESRWMDEHMFLQKGRVARLPGAIVDENLNSLTWWMQKHNHYASREAVDLLDGEFGFGATGRETSGLNRQARIKRWIKVRLYARLPLIVRPWLYFSYRVIFRLGILDGVRGLMFHCLQGLCYRLLVDAKVLEVKDFMKREGCDVHEAIRRVLGIQLQSPEASARRQTTK
jgi:glycosyltransferase involved in cell wall biosynthesis